MAILCATSFKATTCPDTFVTARFIVGAAAPGGSMGPCSPGGSMGPCSPGGSMGPCSPGGSMVVLVHLVVLVVLWVIAYHFVREDPGKRSELMRNSWLLGPGLLLLL